MERFEKGAKIVEGRMTFLQKFLQEKYGFWIFIVFIIVGGFVTAIIFFNKGVATGEKSAISEVSSLKSSRFNDSLEIRALNSRVWYYKKSLDTCNSGSMSSNLELVITKKLEEAERIRRLVERKIINDQKDVKTLDNIIKN